MLFCTNISSSAKDSETATKVSTFNCTVGHAHTEIWMATKWDRFKEISRAVSSVFAGRHVTGGKSAGDVHKADLFLPRLIE